MDEMNQHHPKDPWKNKPWINRRLRDRLICEDYFRVVSQKNLSVKYVLSLTSISDIVSRKELRNRRSAKESLYGSTSRDMFVAEFGRAPEVLYHLMPHIEAIRSIAEGDER
jgi:hypothetical protein